MSDLQNQILFITLMAAGSFMTTDTIKASYQNVAVRSVVNR